jgi:hypothetical protein
VADACGRAVVEHQEALMNSLDRKVAGFGLAGIAARLFGSDRPPAVPLKDDVDP